MANVTSYTILSESPGVLANLPCTRARVLRLTPDVVQLSRDPLPTKTGTFSGCPS